MSEPILIWSVSGLFRLEVQSDVLPPDAEDLAGMLALALETIHRKANQNAWKRLQFDPIYLGM